PKGGGHRKVASADQPAFSPPTEPVVREIAIPETITVGELAHRMSVKAGEARRSGSVPGRRRRGTRRGRSYGAAAGRHGDGPRRSRQDVAARLYPPHQGRGGRGGWHHAAHRRVPR